MSVGTKSPPDSAQDSGHNHIEDVLGRISTTKASDIATLTPWAAERN